MTLPTTDAETGADPSPNGDITELQQVTVRFAGDSGDGMQLAGNRFADTSAAFGNDLYTLPSFPAEIRAPAGTLPGVSSFQIQIADWDISTSGDRPDCMVAMNPAALKSNIADLRQGGTLIVNNEAFDERGLAKAGYEDNPLIDGSLNQYDMIQIPMNTLTKEAVADKVSGRSVLRSRNFVALGFLAWLFQRPLEPIKTWTNTKFARIPNVAEANLAALKAGYNFGVTTEASRTIFKVNPATLPVGTYTNLTGNTALAWGLIAASYCAKLPLFYGSYPITPASDILHELARHKRLGVRTFQAEDEIAAVGAAIGASFGGSLAVTGSSGPGIALKSEAISLALTAELPLLVVNVQRAGPSTGMPTKPEQTDLLFSLFGRHGESPMPVIACSTPSDVVETTIEAARIALKYMTPVILLSDNHIANGSEPWSIPDAGSLPDISVPFASAPNGANGQYLPYLRDFNTFSRPWAIPGTKGLEHRIGGLEKENISGNISYNPENHQLMTDSRAWKVANIANDVPAVEVSGELDADLLVLSWGSSKGTVGAACRNLNREGYKIAYAHLRYLNPLPANLGEVVHSYEKLMIPELNMGQLRYIIRANYLKDAVGLNKVAGTPFYIGEIRDKILEIVEP
ncbi:MAG: 2-oxoacid:acceptor oxidoreductase subunit alpha [Acidimicrobiia bacterium]|nr:2-oxoacid:acceptor oxidoreductase subunit alpha [Acidimicrobiia bacterium]